MQTARARRAPRQQIEGGFLLRAASPEEVFTPEDMTDEQRMVSQSAREFFDREVAPHGDRLEEHGNDIVRELIRRAAEVGFLATEVPESYGGLDMGLIPAMLQVEQFSRRMSFTISIATQTGIGSLPIVFFGSEEQKRRYLPKIISGEMVCAFALTEGHSGSDALGSRVTATLDSAGRNYLLNGQKMWVTNAGIADLFIVFAKVEAKHFTAFLVERNWPGVSLGAEESKMGMRGSSTRPLLFEDAPVPLENVLGEVGAGHKVAFGTLNEGRLKLGAGLVGASKDILSLSAAYSQERKAFGRRIADFGLIQEKLARMAAQIYAAESVVYRTAGLLAEDILSDGMGFAIEASAVKVFTSEMIDFVVDEGVQIHGSNGYSSAYPVERIYRDARVCRIFEGTNEIHRLLILDRLMKLSQSEALPLQKAAADAWSQAGVEDRARAHDSDPLAVEHQLCERSRKLALILMGAAVESFGEKLSHQQMLLAALSDLAIETFASDSLLVRMRKAIERGVRIDGDGIRISAVKLFLKEAFDRVRVAASKAAGTIIAARPNPALESAVNNLISAPFLDCASLCKQISAGVVAAGGYPF